MNISTNTIGNSLIVKVEIEKMLGYEAEEFQNAVVDAFEKGNKSVIVDLSKVKFISSWSIGVLIHGLTTAKNRDAEFKIAGASEHILDTFRKIKIDKIFDLYGSIDEAMKK